MSEAISFQAKVARAGSGAGVRPCMTHPGLTHPPMTHPPMTHQAKGARDADGGALPPFEFPRTLLLCGDKDPLLASQAALATIFVEQGCPAQSAVYNQ